MDMIYLIQMILFNGTDILLSDRRKYYFNNTETSCQEDCKYSQYLFESKQLECECSVNQKEIDPKKENTFDGNILISSFYDVLKFSNFLVLKCYRLVFSYKGQKNNHGSMIIIGYFIIYTIFNIIYFANGFHYIKLYSSQILFNNQLNYNKKKVDSKNKIQKKNTKSVLLAPPKKTIKIKQRKTTRRIPKSRRTYRRQ